MKVQCKSIINPVTGARERKSPWVRIGQEYIVLSVMASPGRRVDLRILVSDDGQYYVPSWWDSEMFVTTDPRIAANWTAHVTEGGVVHLGPDRWMAPGFWERYFDREPDAVAVFEEELALMGGDAELR